MMRYLDYDTLLRYFDSDTLGCDTLMQCFARYFDYTQVGPGTEAVAGEGLIVTYGAMDSHIHYICPQQAAPSRPIPACLRASRLSPACPPPSTYRCITCGGCGSLCGGYVWRLTWKGSLTRIFRRMHIGRAMRIAVHRMVYTVHRMVLTVLRMV